VVNIKAGQDMNAKNLKTGKTLSAIRHSVRFKEYALKTLLEKKSLKTPRHQTRLSNEQLKARLIVFIGVCLSLVFAVSVMGMLFP